MEETVRTCEIQWNEWEGDSHVEVLDGLLSIHHFTWKWELKVGVRVVYVHRCVHVGACTVVGCAAMPDESKQSKTAEGEGKGSERDEGGSPIRRTEQAHPEVAASAPVPRRALGRKNEVSKVAAARSSGKHGLWAKQPD